MRYLIDPERSVRKLLSLLCLFFALFVTPAQAALKVLSCEPEWASLLNELAGQQVSVTSATTAWQDPHHIEARPSLIARARSADLLVCTGLELEVGWLPILLQQSANAKIARGSSGNFIAGDLVPHLDVPTRVDRSEGDVHASGNPHIQQDPRNIALIAAALSERLSILDPKNKAYYQARYQDFSARWSSAMQRWAAQAKPLQGVAVVEHHQNMEYLLAWLGMRRVGVLEAKPGIEPTAAHLNQLRAQLQNTPAKMILRAAYQDDRASLWLSERAHIPAVRLPFTVGGSPQAQDLFGLFDDTLQALLAAAK
ncbi:MAG: zinc ABC transporter substrate-binding protein [Pseudomonadota bacterium]